jgi:hypothetical protein
MNTNVLEFDLPREAMGSKALESIKVISGEAICLAFLAFSQPLNLWRHHTKFHFKQNPSGLASALQLQYYGHINGVRIDVRTCEVCRKGLLLLH